MRRLKSLSSTLYCFSPPVMLITFILEFSLAGLTIWRYHRTVMGRLITLTLLCLGTFQLSEYIICVINPNSVSWAKFGIVAITFLPPLGLHLLSIIRKNYTFVWTGYILALIFSVLYLLPGITNCSTCGGNYVILNSTHGVGSAWGIYYYALLLLAVYQGVSDLLRYKAKNDDVKSKLIVGMIFGYLSFMVPMGLVYIVSPTARQAVPSIMCGFALILAFVLALYVAPLYHKTHKK